MEHPEETPWFRAVDPKSFGASVRSARHERNLTQAGLAELINASRHTIVRLEQGENVSLETALAAVRALQRDIALIPRFSRLDIKK